MTLTGERPEWQRRADCRDYPVDMFFPGRGEATAPARAVCAGCPVKVECLNWALDLGEHHGIYGGTSERERRTMRRQRNFGVSVPHRSTTPVACQVAGCDFTAAGPQGLGSHMKMHRRAGQRGAA